MGPPTAAFGPEAHLFERPFRPLISYQHHRFDPVEGHRAKAVPAGQPHGFGTEAPAPVLPADPEPQLGDTVRRGPVKQSDLPDRLCESDGNDREGDALPSALLSRDSGDKLPSGRPANPCRQEPRRPAVAQNRVQRVGIG